MKKIAIASALLLASGTASAGQFLMLDPTGAEAAPADNGTTDTRTFTGAAGSWALSSPNKFFGVAWTAHDGTSYNTLGSYEFNTVQLLDGTRSQAHSYQVDLVSGYTLGHILFNWGAVADIDVINVWDAAGDSIDIDGSGIRGIGMVDGAFPTFNANFNTDTALSGASAAENYLLQPGAAVAAVPVPAAVWLFGSGLLGLVGVARRKKAA